MPTMNRRSRFTLWFVEAIISLNILYLSGYPLIRTAQGEQGNYNASGLLEGSQSFLTGSGPYTASFWLRLLSIAAALLIIFAFPRKSAPKKYLKWRVKADFTLAFLFFYVTWLSVIFGTFSDYLWIQPIVYSLIMGIAYISNSWWLNNDR